MKGWGKMGGEGRGGTLPGCMKCFFTEYVSSAIKREKESAMQIQYYPDCLLFIAL